MKIALGMIVRGFRTGNKLMSFIKDAEKHGHELDCVIVACSHEYSKEAVQKISEMVPLHVIDIHNPEYCRTQLKKRGLSEKALETLLKCPTDKSVGLVPYGHNRTAVVMEAILRGVDVLVFVDSDVECSVLTKTPGGDVLQEVDFFGEHLKHLKNGADITTSEYSGYNILPHADFDAMEDLLCGIQKENMLQYWRSSSEHRCLIYQPDKVEAKPCDKILGGNLAMRLDAFRKLPPFFSSCYASGREIYLCRGEDTLLGLESNRLGLNCIDIGIYPLHDTYDGYPAEPDLRNDIKTQLRFFFACTGWIGRNPFLNHILGKDLQRVKEYQREHLIRGVAELVRYTSNTRFDLLVDCFDASWNNLERYVSEFNRVTEAWLEFQKGAFGQ